MQDALDSVSKSRTTLTIAHKLSTIQKADNIAVMSQGAVVEQGTHQELLSRNGAYARLVRAQSLEQAQVHETDQHARQIDAERSHSEADQVAGEKIKRTKTDASVYSSEDPTGEPAAKEEMGYSLIKCLYLLVKEQPRWWPLYAALAVVSLLAGTVCVFQNMACFANAYCQVAPGR